MLTARDTSSATVIEVLKRCYTQFAVIGGKDDVVIAVEQHVARESARERAYRPAAEQETRCGAAKFSPDGHERNL